MKSIALVYAEDAADACVRAASADVPTGSTYFVDGGGILAASGDADLYFEVVANPRDRVKHFDVFRTLACPVGASMLADARAREFLRAAGYEAYWREKGWPPQCRPKGDADFECAPAPFEGAAPRGASP